MLLSSVWHGFPYFLVNVIEIVQFARCSLRYFCSIVLIVPLRKFLSVSLPCSNILLANIEDQRFDPVNILTVYT